MKVEKVKNEVVKTFGNLCVGEAFLLYNGFPTDIYIKTYEFTCEEYYNEETNDCEYNAFILNTGEPAWIEVFTEVIVPNCKVIIE